MRRRWAAWFMAAAVTGAAWAGPNGRWIHVHVTERSGGDSRVDVQLPLSMLTTLLPRFAAHVDVKGGIQIDGKGMDAADVRDLWRAVKASRDGEFVTVRSDGDQIHVSKRSGVVLVDVQESGARGSKVRMRLPVALVDAFVEQGRTLDDDDVDRLFAEFPSGDLVTVDGDGDHVRIWVDGRPEASRGDE